MNSRSITDYLVSRGVTDKDFVKAIQTTPAEAVQGITLHVGDEDYELNYLLDTSGRNGHDIEDVNDAIGLAKTNLVAFALVAGDDPVCLNVTNRSIIVLLLEEGTQVRLANSPQEFTGIIYGS